MVREGDEGGRHIGVVARVVGRDGAGWKRGDHHREARCDDRLSHRGVLVHLGREGQVGERIAACRGEADVGGRDRRRDVVDRDAAVEGHSTRDPELLGELAERFLGVTPAVDLEPRIEVRAIRREPCDGPDGDVDLVGRA